MAFRLVILIVIISTSSLARGQTPGAGVPPPDAQQPVTDSGTAGADPVSACKGTIDGHAVDAATHEPVVAASVRIGNNLLATTDDAGRFSLSGLCPGDVTVVVERPDYAPASAP